MSENIDQDNEDYTDRLADLVDLINEYSELFQKADFHVFLLDIANAYKCKKPLSSFDLYRLDIKLKEKFDSFLEALHEYFFVNDVIFDETNTSFSIIVYVTRYKGVYEFTLKNKFKDSINGDIYGILYGYSSKEVYEYCWEQAYDHLIK